MASFPDTRASLILRIADARNARAWDEFAHLYQPVVYRLARQRGFQHADAEELVQEAMLSVARAVERFRRSPLRAASGSHCPPRSHAPKAKAVGRRLVEKVMRYCQSAVTIGGCTHLLFRDDLEVVTTSSRFHFRRAGENSFRDSPLTMCNDAHAVACHARDQLYYATDTGNHRLFSFHDSANGDRLLRHGKNDEGILRE